MAGEGVNRLLEGSLRKGGHAITWDDSVPAPSFEGDAREPAFGDVFRATDGSYYVFIDVCSRGTATEFYTDSGGNLRYCGGDPSVRSDGMEFGAGWADATPIDADGPLEYVGQATSLPPALEAWRHQAVEWMDEE